MAQRPDRPGGFRRLLTRAVIGLLIAGVMAYVAMGLWIGSSVRETTRKAQARFAGPPVEALIRVAQDERSSLPSRNRAIWALGQLGDPRALSALEALYDGKPCDHAHRLCQRELRKALQLCDGAFNLAGIVWKPWVLPLE